MMIFLIMLSDSFISIQFFPHCQLFQDKDFCLFFFLCLVCITLNFSQCFWLRGYDTQLWWTLYSVELNWTAISPELHMAALFSSFKSLKCHLHTEVYSGHLSIGISQNYSSCPSEFEPICKYACLCSFSYAVDDLWQQGFVYSYWCLN